MCERYILLQLFSINNYPTVILGYTINSRIEQCNVLCNSHLPSQTPFLWPQPTISATISVSSTFLTFPFPSIFQPNNLIRFERWLQRDKRQA